MILSELKVANCRYCGNVFQKNLRNMCNDCIGKFETDYNNCVQYLRAHLRATMDELCRDTGISLQQMMRWVRDGKLLLSDFPNLDYPCSTCETPIREHKLCPSCRIQINKEIHKLYETEKPQSTASFSNEGTKGYKIKNRIARR